MINNNLRLTNLFFFIIRTIFFNIVRMYCNNANINFLLVEQFSLKSPYLM